MIDPYIFVLSYKITVMKVVVRVEVDVSGCNIETFLEVIGESLFA